jgi:hypothetical protein
MIEKMISMQTMLQNFFDHTLLAKLVDRGVLSVADAREIATKTATFAHELADEPDRTQIATGLARQFELMAEGFVPESHTKRK